MSTFIFKINNRSLHKIIFVLSMHGNNTVEPLTNDHPHQQPSLLLYDHISCDGQCFLLVRSLTNDHRSNATNDRVRWDFFPPRERPLRVQCISKNRGWRFNIRSRGRLLQCCAQTPLKLFNCFEISFILVASLQCCQPADAQTPL